MPGDSTSSELGSEDLLRFASRCICLFNQNTTLSCWKCTVHEADTTSAATGKSRTVRFNRPPVSPDLLKKLLFVWWRSHISYSCLSQCQPIMSTHFPETETVKRSFHSPLFIAWCIQCAPSQRLSARCQYFWPRTSMPPGMVWIAMSSRCLFDVHLVCCNSSLTGNLQASPVRNKNSLKPSNFSGRNQCNSRSWGKLVQRFTTICIAIISSSSYVLAVVYEGD